MILSDRKITIEMSERHAASLLNLLRAVDEYLADSDEELDLWDYLDYSEVDDMRIALAAVQEAMR